jgi:hypothetical protein
MTKAVIQPVNRHAELDKMAAKDFQQSDLLLLAMSFF